MWQPCARDSGNKIAASAHGMGSGGSAVDAMVIGCLGVERRAERFFSYLAILHYSSKKPFESNDLFQVFFFQFVHYLLRVTQRSVRGLNTFSYQLFLNGSH